MRLLLDELLPRRLAHELPGHEVENVRAIRWGALENGRRLEVAANAGFDALLTSDRGFEFEQNLDTLPLSVVIVRAATNSPADLSPLMPLVSETLLENRAKISLLKVGG